MFIIGKNGLFTLFTLILLACFKRIYGLQLMCIAVLGNICLWKLLLPSNNKHLE